MSKVEIEEQLFLIDMIDHWTESNRIAYDKYSKMLKDLESEEK